MIYRLPEDADWIAAWLRWLGAYADPTDGCECLYLDEGLGFAF